MIEKEPTNLRAKDETDPGMHDENLFDQDETRAGERWNLATGKPIDNSTSTGMEGLEVIVPSAASEDVLGPLPEENDEAAEWLRQHGR